MFTTLRVTCVPTTIDANTKEAIIRFENGGWLTMRNLGWGIFKVTGASDELFRYLDWSYYLEMPTRVKASWPRIDLFDGNRFHYLTHLIVVGIESLDDTWR